MASAMAGPAVTDNGQIHQFKNVEYLVQLDVTDTLQVRVEERYTCECWAASFDRNYVEELTRRTGNYKPLNVFTSMLKAAVAGTNPSVKLELLTYSDLEALRAQKTGVSGFTAGASASGFLDASTASATARGSNKRYLIMTFSSEFDRVHYPLPLHYAGRPEPAQLQAVIRQLYADLQGATDAAARSSTAVMEMQSAYDELAKERHALLRDVQALQKQQSQQQQQRGAGPADPHPTQSPRAASREVEVLKQVVTKLESDLMTERTKHQRAMQKKQSEMTAMAAEIEALRESERSLQIRCRNLAGETALRRKAASKATELRRTPHSGERRSAPRSASAERRALHRPASGRTDRSPKHTRRSGDRVSLRASADRLTRGEKPHVKLTGRAHSRSPSPARFDPTEYVRLREEKLQAARAARELNIRRARSRSASPLTRSRGSSPVPRGRSRDVKPVGGGGGGGGGRRKASRSPAEAGRQSGGRRRESGASRRRESPSPSPRVVHSPRSATEYSPPTAGATASGGGGGGVERGGGGEWGDTGADAAPTSGESWRVRDYFKNKAQETDIDARLAALAQILQSSQATS